jgi:hypothetical protein
MMETVNCVPFPVGREREPAWAALDPTVSRPDPRPNGYIHAVWNWHAAQPGAWALTLTISLGVPGLESF